MSVYFVSIHIIHRNHKSSPNRMDRPAFKSKPTQKLSAYHILTHMYKPLKHFKIDRKTNSSMENDHITMIFHVMFTYDNQRIHEMGEKCKNALESNNFTSQHIH